MCMNEMLHANIFFFITGIAVIVFTTLLCVALFHFIKVLKSLRHIMERIEEGTEVIAEDMHHVREFFTQEGFIGRLITTLTGSWQRAPRAGEKAPRNKKSTTLHITE